MRTVQMILIGFVVLGGFVLASYAAPTLRRPLLWSFIGGWLLWCLWDTRQGTLHGYSWGAELLIHLPIFALPAAVAFLVLRRIPA